MRVQTHVAITRMVKPGCREAFEKAIRTFFADSLGEPGSMGVQLLSPLPGSQNRTYVPALTWVVMPTLIRLLRPWLIRPADTYSRERNGS